MTENNEERRDYTGCDTALARIEERQGSVFRELNEMKTQDLKAISDKLTALNGSVAANTRRSIQSEVQWEMTKLSAKIGIPVAASLIVMTYCGIW